MRRFGAGLSKAQIALARAFERAGITTYSQAIKALQRREDEKIEIWKKELNKK